MRLCVFDQSSTVIPLKLFNGQITPFFVSVGRWLSGRGWWRWRCWTGEWGPPRVAMRWVGSLMGPAGVICPGLAKLPRTTGVTMTREKFTVVSLTFTHGEQVFGDQHHITHEELVKFSPKRSWLHDCDEEERRLCWKLCPVTRSPAWELFLPTVAFFLSSFYFSSRSAFVHPFILLFVSPNILTHL